MLIDPPGHRPPRPATFGEPAPTASRVAFIVAIDTRQVETMRDLLSHIPSSRIMPISGERPAADVRLTARQREILSLLLDNLSNKEIARRLAISHFTVRNHVSRLLDIFGVPNRGAMIATRRASGIAPQ